MKKRPQLRAALDVQSAIVGLQFVIIDTCWWNMGILTILEIAIGPLTFSIWINFDPD